MRGAGGNKAVKGDGRKHCSRKAKKTRQKRQKESKKLTREALPRRVAGVDDDQPAHAQPARARRRELRAQRLHVERPAFGLVELVGHELAAVERQGGGVQWILRDRHEPRVAVLLFCFVLFVLLFVVVD